MVLAIMPAAYLLRSTRFYRYALMPIGSMAIVGLALVWFIERIVG